MGRAREWIRVPTEGTERRAPSAASDRPTPTPVLPPAPVGPMTLSDVLDGSYTIIKRRPRAVIGSVAVIVVPVQVFSVWLRSTLDGLGRPVVAVSRRS